MSQSYVSESPELTAQDFQKISKLAYEKFGLKLPPGKEGLVAARLGKKIRMGQFASFADYYDHVLADRSGDALTELIDSLTTNFTSFFREPAHFEFLKTAAKGEFRDVASLRVWSAACSSGEEPYTIAMTLADVAQGSAYRWANDIKIVATDISTRVLKKAQSAIYESERFTQMPDGWSRNYLLKGNGASSGCFKLKPAITRLVQFERLNLIEPMPRRLFHVIFCRNVMIYFDKQTQQDMVCRLSACLEPGGYLFVGHSESLNAIEHPLRYIRPAIYRKEATAAERGRL